MVSKPVRITGLFLLLGAVLLGLWLLKSHKPVAPKLEESILHVSVVQIERNGQKVQLVKNNGEWALVLPSGSRLRIDNGRVQDYLLALSKLQPVRYIPISQRLMAESGLQRAQYHVRICGSNFSYGVRFSLHATTTGHVYMWVEGSNQIGMILLKDLITLNTVEAQLDQSVFLKAKKNQAVFEIDLSRADHLEFFQGDRRITVSRVSEHWINEVTGQEQTDFVLKWMIQCMRITPSVAAANSQKLPVWGVVISGKDEIDLLIEFGWFRDSSSMVRIHNDLFFDLNQMSIPKFPFP